MASEVGRYPEILTTQWALVWFSVAVLYVISWFLHNFTSQDAVACIVFWFFFFVLTKRISLSVMFGGSLRSIGFHATQAFFFPCR